MTKHYPLFFLILLFLMLQSCGGGGSDASNEGSVTGLSGRLIMPDGEELDVATEKVLNTFSDEVKNGLVGAEYDDFFIYPSKDESQLLVADFNCFIFWKDTGSSFDVADNDCVYITDPKGQLLHKFMVVEDLSSVSLSPDGQTIAAVWNEGEISNEENRATLFNLDGDVLARSTRGIGAVEWLPDGRLIAASEDRKTIFLTNQPYQFNAKAIGHFKERLRNLSVSPDGKQLAFTLQEDGDKYKHNIWLMNIDGTHLRQLTRDADGKDPEFESPVWSPDGKWIMLMKGYVATSAVIVPDDPTGDSIVLGSLGGLYAVRTDVGTLDFSKPLDPSVVHKMRHGYGSPIAWLPAHGGRKGVARLSLEGSSAGQWRSACQHVNTHAIDRFVRQQLSITATTLTLQHEAYRDSLCTNRLGSVPEPQQYNLGAALTTRSGLRATRLIPDPGHFSETNRLLYLDANDTAYLGRDGSLDFDIAYTRY
jgi:hypothetical protein